MLNLPSSEEPSRGQSVRWQHSAEINANAPHEDETQEGVGRLGHLLTAQERKAPPRGWGFVLEVWGGIESSHRNSTDNKEIFKPVVLSNGRGEGTASPPREHFCLSQFEEVGEGF